ncbi:hypothetical protein BN871_ED_00100 [Paenibacillus sp. P22]|nr:hypothetical protein BN871_ED_00100 [Paenibacillus sp. P22]
MTRFFIMIDSIDSPNLIPLGVLYFFVAFSSIIKYKSVNNMILIEMNFDSSVFINPLKIDEINWCT